MKRSVFYLFFILLLFACGGSDDGGDSIDTDDDNPIGMQDDDQGDPQDESQGVGATTKLDIQGATDLDFSSLMAVSESGSSPVSDNGAFENTSKEIEEDLPIIFVNSQDELIFGYYPKGNDQTVKINDIIKFYIKSFPSIALFEIEDEIIDQVLSTSSTVLFLEEEILTALNLNISPFDNESFQEQFLLFLEEILGLDERTNKSRDIVGEFAFDYQSDGSIQWPSSVPLFAGLGIEILDDSGNVAKTDFIKPKSLGLAAVLDNILFPGQSSEPNFQMNQKGSYNINFSNGNPYALDFQVDARDENYNIFTSKAISILLPVGLKYFTRRFNECTNALINLHRQGKQEVGRIVLQNRITSEDAINFILTLSRNLINVTAKCGGGYFATLLQAATKVVRLVFQTSDMVFFLRDFFGSEIGGSQIRYYNEGLAYGDLKYTHLTDLEITGKTGDTFRYEGFVEEQVITYDVDRNTGISRFLPKEEFNPIEGISFGISLVSGDAILNGSNPISSNSNGVVILEGQFGEQDSEITIEQLTIHNEVALETLNLKVEIDSDNDGILDNVDLCPDTPSGETVDPEGCSVSQKDSDGDGIDDSVDLCPDTPAGETVDATGCVDEWDPQDPSTWPHSREKIARVSGVVFPENGTAGFTFNLALSGTAVGNNQLVGTWEYDGRTFHVELSRTIEFETTNENGETVTESCNLFQNFTGTVTQSNIIWGNGNNGCSSCCDGISGVARTSIP